ncbi:MAG: energy transducer TonB [Haliscomenobacter sp.]|nr:energy transducer TonB [Haliscomenobacter sp.]
MEPITVIKTRLIDTLPLGIDLVLKALKASIPPLSGKYDDYILLASRYRELNERLIRGVLTNEEAQVEFNKLSEAILAFISGLEEADLQEQAPEEHVEKGIGKLLYRIPDVMEHLQEEKCLVRIAFDKATLMEELTGEASDVVKDIRIAEVMGAELIDPNEDKAFAIRTFTEAVQFLDEAAYTEWLFYVKPLLVGRFPLLLKISVVEILDGKERKRQVILEESVEVTTEPVSVQDEELKSSGLVIKTAAQTTISPLVPPAPQPSVRPSYPEPESAVQPEPKAITEERPQPKAPPRSRRKKAGLTVGALALVGVAMATFSVLYFQSRQSSSEADDLPFVEFNKRVKTSSDTNSIKEFLDQYPESPFTKETLAKLDSLRQLNRVFEPVKDTTALLADTITATPPPSKPTPPDSKKPVVKPKAKSKTKAATQTKTSPKTGETAPPKGNTEEPQEQPAPPKEEVIAFSQVAREPIFKGCPEKDPERALSCFNRKMNNYLKANLVKPEEAARRNLSGTVTVKFIIEKDGRVTIESINDPIGYGCKETASKLIASLPRFTPGKDAKGNPVRVRYLLPIQFQ